MVRLTLLAACVPLLLGAMAAQADEVRRVTGHARGLDAGARERAIDMAVREAVLEAIHERVQTTRITPYEDLLAQAGDFVADMRIVDFDRHDGVSMVELAVRLHEHSLRAAIANAWLRDAPFMPRAVVVSAIRQGSGPYRVAPGHAAQSTLESALTQAGIEVVGLDEIMQYQDADALSHMVTDPREAAPRLARAHLCEAAIILLATVEAELLPESSNVHAVTARVSMVAASPRDGVPVHTETTEALIHGADPDQAAEAAINNAAARLSRLSMPLVILAAAAAEARTEDIVVTVEGGMDPDAIEALRAGFEALPGVENVEVLFHTTRGARLRVGFPDAPAAFIEPALQDLPSTPELEVMRVVNREMRLRVKATAE